MSKPIYSFGIIFKDEIRCLERCLKSLQPLRDAVPCEIVMADTGSTDGSREIAEKYADILFDFPWCDDFSAARNAVMDRCSGVWYFSIDADEWLAEDISELIAFSREKKLPRDFGGVVIRNYQSIGLEKDQKYVDFIAIRIARLNTGIRYQGCIHEAWKAPDGGDLKTMSLQETMLYHDGYVYANKGAEQKKHDRNMILLKKKLKNDPNDIQTLVECTDSSKHQDAESADYARRAVELVNEKHIYWDKLGSVVFRNAVSVAQLHHLPEIEDWIEQGWGRFFNSVFTQVDLTYYAFAHYFDQKDYPKAICWGERYQHGLADHRAGLFPSEEYTRGVLEFESPFWERKVSVLLLEAYLENGELQKALAGFQEVKGNELEDAKQVELCVNMLMRIHRTTQLDTANVLVSFWDQINEPFPDEDRAKMRRTEFFRAAANAFTRQYRDEEKNDLGFLRHSFGIFAVLEGGCALGTAAVMLEMDDPRALEEQLFTVKDWNELPISALAHALKHGITFPLSGSTLDIEKMDHLACRLATDKEILFSLACQTAGTEFGTYQDLAWARGLLFAAVRAFDWDSQESDADEGISLVRSFAQVEKEFLPFCYAPQILCRENLFVLPPMHRFGWYCAQAFDALDAGDSVGYVRLLREGLTVCEGVKDMVEFLTEHTHQLQAPRPSAELTALADQIRTILSVYSPNDPAVMAIKNSEAYQKVKYLIEGLEVPIVGGLAQ